LVYYATDIRSVAEGISGSWVLHNEDWLELSSFDASDFEAIPVQSTSLGAIKVLYR
jgi:hypothetical protein